MKIIITESQYKNLLIPRRIDGRAERWKIIIQRQIQQYIKNGSVGDLDLSNSPIEKLPDNLTKVGGYLNLSHSQIQDLGKLESVGGHLWLYRTKIKFLNNLEYVGGSLDLDHTPIKSLGNLKYVGRNLYLKKTPLGKKYTKKQIRQIVEVNGGYISITI